MKWMNNKRLKTPIVHELVIETGKEFHGFALRMAIDDSRMFVLNL